MKRASMFLVASMLGCGATSAGPAAPGPPPALESTTTGPILISIRGWMMTQNFAKQGILQMNDTLLSGDYFAFYVRVDKPAYIYLLQFLPDGRANVAFPEGNAIKIPSGKETRIPTDPNVWFQLDQSTGQEFMYVIASGKPIEVADTTLAGLIKDIRLSGRPSRPEPVSPTSLSAPKPAVAIEQHSRPSGPSRSPRPKMRLDPKGVKAVRIPGGAPVYQGRTGEDGVGVLSFPFEHR